MNGSEYIGPRWNSLLDFYYNGKIDTCFIELCQDKKKQLSLAAPGEIVLCYMLIELPGSGSR